MVGVPPAVIGVLHLLPTLLGWPLATYATLYALRDILQVSLPTWFIVIVCLVSNPLAYTTKSYLREKRDQRNAAAQGAVLAPMIDLGEFAVMRQFLKAGKDEPIPGSIVNGFTKRFGHTFRIKASGEGRLVTNEPEHIKAILATQFNSFKKGPLNHAQLKELLGDGVFVTDDDMWKFHRSMTRPFFARDRISDFDIFDRHAVDTITAIKGRLAEGQPVDFSDVVARFTLDSASEFLFGKDVRSLDAGLPYPGWSAKPNPPQFETHPSNTFVRAFVGAQNHAINRIRRGGMWQLFEPYEDKLRVNRKIIDDFTMPILKEALERKREMNEKSIEEGSDKTFLAHLVNSTADHKVIADSIVNILVAGRDTTATTLTFALYMLTEHPDIVKRLRDEVLGKVGPSARPTYDDIRELKYLRAFINEVLRLYPAVPFNLRITVEPVILPPPAGSTTPIYVPAGTRCNWGIFIMHRRKDLWGPSALEFDPDRFLDDRLHKYLTPNPFIFLPFNAGPRICLGQQFAYNEMSFFLVRLLQNFKTFALEPKSLRHCETPEGWKGEMETKIPFHNSLTLAVSEGLWLNMEEAGSLDG